MKVNLALEKSITDDNFYLVINDTFYLGIQEQEFVELAEFVGISLKEKDDEEATKDN